MLTVLAGNKGSLVDLSLIPGKLITEKQKIAFIWIACDFLTCRLRNRESMKCQSFELSAMTFNLLFWLLCILRYT